MLVKREGVTAAEGEGNSTTGENRENTTFPSFPGRRGRQPPQQTRPLYFLEERGGS